MKRRNFITLVGGAAAWPLAARGQQPTKMPRLCFLTFDPGTAQSPSTRFERFFQALRQLGYVNGQTLTIDYLSAEGRTDQYPALAAECVRLNPDIIAVTTTPGAHALKRATGTIPIVMYGLGDPVGTGLVESLAHPGGNVTGVTNYATGLAAKRLELLKEVVPSISRALVASYGIDPVTDPQLKELAGAATTLGVKLLVHDIRTADDLPTAFDVGIRDGAEGLVATAASIFIAERKRMSG